MSKVVTRDGPREPVSHGHNGGPPLEPQLVYTLPDAARQLGIGVSSLYQMRKKNMITFTAIAGRRVITRAELERVLAAAVAGDPAHRSGRVQDLSPTEEEDRPAGG